MSLHKKITQNVYKKHCLSKIAKITICHKSLLWSDSMSVIRDIRNTAARFKTFVDNRLSVIHEGPDMENWNYVM